MSREDIDRFFNEYVFGFIFNDVQREIDLAASGKTAGNFLAALGLLCYTEVMGGIRRTTLKQGNGRCNFETFLRYMGDQYGALLDADPPLDVYRDFRCGMAHEYLTKGAPPFVTMLNGAESAGVGRLPGGRLHFCVQRYFEDFAPACHRLYAELRCEPDPKLPRQIAGR